MRLNIGLIASLSTSLILNLSSSLSLSLNLSLNLCSKFLFETESEFVCQCLLTFEEILSLEFSLYQSLSSFSSSSLGLGWS